MPCPTSHITTGNRTESEALSHITAGNRTGRSDALTDIIAVNRTKSDALYNKTTTKGFMHIFVKCNFLDSFDALATNTQNFLRKVGTERHREISGTGREIFVLSERTLG